MRWRSGRWPWWLVVGAMVLIVVRMFLPYAVRSYLNQRMAHMGDYRGHIDDIDIHLWRGAYSVDRLRIDKVSGNMPVPLFDAPRTEIALSWRALSHGVLRGKIDFSDATINFVDGNNDSDRQTGNGVDWRAQLRLLTPTQLEEVGVHNGTVTFQNFVSHPRVDLRMTQVNGTVTNLTNVDQRQGQRVAQLHVTAKILQDAPLEANASFDPLERYGDFSYQLRVTGIQLVRANSLARAYTGLDFAGGSGDFIMELEAKDRQLDGYAKPLFHNLQLFSWKQDVEQDNKGPLKLAYEAVAQGVVSVFKNHENNQFATRVPISGQIGEKQMNALPAILGVLRNAFIKAYSSQLENLTPAPSGK